MKKMFAHFTGENAAEYNLLSQKEMNQIRIKLGKDDGDTIHVVIEPV